LHTALEGFVSPETWKSVSTNKDYIICFPHVGFQLKEKDQLFEAKFVSAYKDVNEVKEQQKNIKSGPITNASADSLNTSEDNDENNVEDLDAKKFTENYPDGSVKSEVPLKNGLRDGNYREYYSNGDVKVKGHYKNDMKDGTFKYYDENGKLKEKKEFEQGKEVK
jgi:antitoxin component YwqK of YwqJK toxin-antitoxin module